MNNIKPSNDSFIADLQQRRPKHFVMLGFCVLVAFGGFYLAATLEPAARGETDWVKVIIVAVSMGLLSLCALVLSIMFSPSTSESANVVLARLIFGGLLLLFGLVIGAATLYAALMHDSQFRSTYILLASGFGSICLLIGGGKLIRDGINKRGTP